MGYKGSTYIAFFLVLQSKKKTVKVLKDEPLPVLQKKTALPGSLAYIAQRGSGGGVGAARIKGPRCGQCEEKAAHVVRVKCSCGTCEVLMWYV